MKHDPAMFLGWRETDVVCELVERPVVSLEEKLACQWERDKKK
jgi:hypothetical protein